MGLQPSVCLTLSPHCPFISLFLSIIRQLQNISHKLIIFLFSLVFSLTSFHLQTFHPLHFASFPPCQCPCQGACQATSVCLLSLSACCPVVAATFWHCIRVSEREREREREREGERDGEREKERQRERRGAKKKGKETRECMQMQGPSRLQICKCCCLCDMQMRDYRALIRVKRTVHVN